MFHLISSGIQPYAVSESAGQLEQGTVLILKLSAAEFADQCPGTGQVTTILLILLKQQDAVADVQDSLFFVSQRTSLSNTHGFGLPFSGRVLQ